MSAGIAAALLVAPLAAGYAPALSQDFSITNPVAPETAGRRDLMRQLQAWWDQHSFYPRHASQNDEGGAVKLHLVILPDGRIWAADVVQSSGSSSLDAAAISTFHLGFVRPFTDGTPEAAVDISLHYVLAHRHDQPVAVNSTQVASRRSFTITNDPVTSPILDTMLLKTCSGTVVKEGIRNHPYYGGHYSAEAVFFRKPDGTPWVKFTDSGRHALLAPVSQVGNLVQWTGPEEHVKKNTVWFYQYSVWAEGDNKLTGSIEAADADFDKSGNHGGTVDFVCATQIVPQITWTALMVNDTHQIPSSDPP